MIEDGWLQEPRTKETLRFYQPDSSIRLSPFILVESGAVQRGRPAMLHTRLTMSKSEATDWWRKLKREGWKLVEPQW